MLGKLGIAYSSPTVDLAPAPRWWRRLQDLLGRRATAPAAQPEIALGDGAVKAVATGHDSCTIHCLEGTVWITHPGAPGDHVLSAGESLTTSGPGDLVVWAFAPSRLARRNS